MKILHVISTMDPKWGGPVQGILSGATLLADLGHERDVVCIDKVGEPWIKQSPIRIYALGSASVLEPFKAYIPWMRFRFNRKLIPWLVRNYRNYDAIIVNGLWNFTSVATWIAIRRKSVPYYIFTHGMLDPWFLSAFPVKGLIKKLYWKFIESKVISGARGILFTTDDERRLATSSFKPFGSIHNVVGYGIGEPPLKSVFQTVELAKLIPELNSKPYILFLSRIDKKKGCDILIKSFAAIALDYPDLQLIMAGPDNAGLKRDLVVLSKRLGVASRVHWTGMIVGTSKWVLIRGAKALALPTHSENFGIVLAEALSCGVPVLTTIKANIWREIKAGNGGLISEDEIASFTKILNQFLSMPDEAVVQMGIDAIEVFYKHFCLNSQINKLITAIS